MRAQSALQLSSVSFKRNKFNVSEFLSRLGGSIMMFLTAIFSIIPIVSEAY